MNRRPLFIVYGSLLVTIAGGMSAAGIETALLGSYRGTLTWGPALFRALLAFHGLLLIAAGFLIKSQASLSPKAKQPAVPLWAWVTLAILTILGLGLRVWRLDTSLWLDEVLTMVDYAKAPMGVVLTSFPNQNQHMFFSVLSNISLRVFGENAWALRLPSVLFGLGSIWALFALGRKLVSVREALFACALMTVSYHHVWFSQNARGYMGLLFFTLFATWIWLEALEHNRPILWVAYAFACALGAWIHMTVVFLVAAHGIAYLLQLTRPDSLERKAGWWPVISWILVGSLTLQFHALALPEFLRTGLHEVSVKSEWTNPLWVVAEVIRSLKVGFLSVTVLVGGAVVAFAGWTGLLRRSPRAALIMVLPGILGATTMLALSHNLWPRFFFFLMGFALLIVIHGVASLTSKLFAPKAAGFLLATAAGVVILASAATLPRCYALPKQDYIGAREYVEQIQPSADAVGVVGLARHVYGRYYAPHWKTIESPAELNAFIQQNRPVSLVYTLPIELAAFHPELWKTVQENFEEQRVFPGSLGGGEVYVCRRKGPNQAARHELVPTELRKVSLQ